MSGCRTCVYWRRRDDRIGRCVRYAPRPVVDFDRLGVVTVWPMTGAGDWCGECVIDLMRADDEDEGSKGPGDG